ncbi:Chitin synthase, class 5 [Apophysomyces sp. BC1034]|nr:Chitin synthase, class 5 [Apophysomyces sp. BC1015]KAG0174348.1 Chitin synthase, class 5 [Apophysomyces sp. BC1021]KAG0190557.1 Chitin synthase, class 5 [Apophysomyces sp. BC1034]
MTSIQFTVGKLDAGMAILLTEDHHLIEFPSLLLPKGVASGSIVNIAVSRNVSEEEKKMQEFWDLQDNILSTFGEVEPEKPILRVENITQTSLTLKWDPLVLHTSKLRSLDVYKNDSKLAQHVPSDTNLIKLSGLDVDHEFEFHIAIRTTAGRYESNSVTVRTHKMENLTGIRVAFGVFEEPASAIAELKGIVDKMGATWTEDVDSETTHLLAQLPGGANYDRAVQHSIPIVKPDWLVQCDKNKKIQSALPYYILSVHSD